MKYPSLTIWDFLILLYYRNAVKWTREMFRGTYSAAVTLTGRDLAYERIIVDNCRRAITRDQGHWVGRLGKAYFAGSYPDSLVNGCGPVFP